MDNSKKRVRIICRVTPQTLWNLRKMAKSMGYGDNIGKVIDKLTREKMISLHTPKININF